VIRKQILAPRGRHVGNRDTFRIQHNPSRLHAFFPKT
jgi:hypothetical protein